MNIYYDAGKLEGRCFYDTPMYDKNVDKEKPSYYSLFIWYCGLPLGGKEITDEPRMPMHGTLNESLFDTIDKKISYLKGVFDSYSGHGLKDNPPTLNFANSLKKAERCVHYMGDINYHNHIDLINTAVSKHNIEYGYVPICVTLICNPLVVDFIKNYKLCT